MEQCNILIYGTGAVGIYFGGKLFQAGFNVVFVDTASRVEILNETGLKIRSKIDKDFDFEPKIVHELDGLPPQDIILVCVKAFQTYDIGLDLLPVIKPSTITMSLQNGLENESILANLLGKNLVMGSVLYFNGKIENESTMVQMAPGSIIFGEMDHQRSEREERLSTIFSHADINHNISSTIVEEIWKKFIWNNAYNAISAITKTTLRQINDFEEILPTVQQMMTEVQQVAQAEGIEFSVQNLEDLVNIDPDFGDVKTSMLKDIEAARRPELEQMVGVVLQKAKKYGISTPVNQTVYNLIRLSLCNIDFEENGCEN